MKIYTKTGDGGKTSLGNKARVSKSHLRLECYGTFDELNSVLALVVDHLQPLKTHVPAFKELVQNCLLIQHDLFDLGAELSLAKEKSAFGDGQAQKNLECQIDEMTRTLAPLTHFVLPGGHVVNSLFHLARTVCRRAERGMITLFESEGWQEGPTAYVNRLSDWFFTAARFSSVHLNCPEVIWQMRALRNNNQPEI